MEMICKRCGKIWSIRNEGRLVYRCPNCYYYHVEKEKIKELNDKMKLKEKNGSK